MDIPSTQLLEDDFDDHIEQNCENYEVGYLIFDEYGSELSEYPIYEGDNTIGRDNSCNISFPYACALSKKHACIEADRSGCYIYDCGSSNKTKLKRLCMKPNVRYCLQNGDVISFANVKCTFKQNVLKQDSPSSCLSCEVPKLLVAETPETSFVGVAVEENNSFVKVVPDSQQCSTDTTNDAGKEDLHKTSSTEQTKESSSAYDSEGSDTDLEDTVPCHEDARNDVTCMDSDETDVEDEALSKLCQQNVQIIDETPQKNIVSSDTVIENKRPKNNASAYINLSNNCEDSDDEYSLLNTVRSQTLVSESQIQMYPTTKDVGLALNVNASNKNFESTDNKVHCADPKLPLHDDCVSKDKADPVNDVDNTSHYQLLSDVVKRNETEEIKLVREESFAKTVSPVPHNKTYCVVETLISATDGVTVNDFSKKMNEAIDIEKTYRGVEKEGLSNTTAELPSEEQSSTSLPTIISTHCITQHNNSDHTFANNNPMANNTEKLVSVNGNAGNVTDDQCNFDKTSAGSECTPKKSCIITNSTKSVIKTVQNDDILTEESISVFSKVFIENSNDQIVEKRILDQSNEIFHKSCETETTVKLRQNLVDFSDKPFGQETAKNGQSSVVDVEPIEKDTNITDNTNSSTEESLPTTKTVYDVVLPDSYIDDEGQSDEDIFNTSSGSDLESELYTSAETQPFVDQSSSCTKSATVCTNPENLERFSSPLKSTNNIQCSANSASKTKISVSPTTPSELTKLSVSRTQRKGRGKNSKFNDKMFIFSLNKTRKLSAKVDIHKDFKEPKSKKTKRSNSRKSCNKDFSSADTAVNGSMISKVVTVASTPLSYVNLEKQSSPLTADTDSNLCVTTDIQRKFSPVDVDNKELDVMKSGINLNKVSSQNTGIISPATKTDNHVQFASDSINFNGIKETIFVQELENKVKTRTDKCSTKDSSTIVETVSSNSAFSDQKVEDILNGKNNCASANNSLEMLKGQIYERENSHGSNETSNKDCEINVIAKTSGFIYNVESGLGDAEKNDKIEITVTNINPEMTCNDMKSTFTFDSDIIKKFASKTPLTSKTVYEMPLPDSYIDDEGQSDEDIFNTSPESDLTNKIYSSAETQPFFDQSASSTNVIPSLCPLPENPKANSSPLNSISNIQRNANSLFKDTVNISCAITTPDKSTKPSASRPKRKGRGKNSRFDDKMFEFSSRSTPKSSTKKTTVLKTKVKSNVSEKSLHPKAGNKANANCDGEISDSRTCLNAKLSIENSSVTETKELSSTCSRQKGKSVAHSNRNSGASNNSTIVDRTFNNENSHGYDPKENCKSQQFIDQTSSTPNSVAAVKPILEDPELSSSPSESKSNIHAFSNLMSAEKCIVFPKCTPSKIKSVSRSKRKGKGKNSKLNNGLIEFSSKKCLGVFSKTDEMKEVDEPIVKSKRSSNLEKSVRTPSYTDTNLLNNERKDVSKHTRRITRSTASGTGFLDSNAKAKRAIRRKSDESVLLQDTIAQANVSLEGLRSRTSKRLKISSEVAPELPADTIKSDISVSLKKPTRRRKGPSKSDDDQVKTYFKSNQSSPFAESEARLETTKLKKQPNALQQTQSNSDISKKENLFESTLSLSDFEEQNLNDDLILTSSLRPRKEKPKVMFTGFIDKPGEAIVKELGGHMTDDMLDCTHLVTDKIRRTVKFMCALVRGIHIVNQDWLRMSKKCKRFLNENDFELSEENFSQSSQVSAGSFCDMKSVYDFNLYESLVLARSRRLFENLQIHVTESVLPPPEQMYKIVLCGGGKCAVKLPRGKKMKNLVVVSAPEDKKIIANALKNNIPVVDKEFILTGILQQKLDFEKFKLVEDASSAEIKKFPDITKQNQARKRSKVTTRSETISTRSKKDLRRRTVAA